MTALTLSGALLRGGTWTPRAALGVIVDGRIRPAGQAEHDVGTGALLTVGADRSLGAGQGAAPALDLSLALSASWTRTTAAGSDERVNYSAVDARAGLRAAWQVGGRFFPYAAARVFGGPVSWRWQGDDVTGSDVHHYQLAVGAAWRLGAAALAVEWAGVGERGFSVGLSMVR